MKYWIFILLLLIPIAAASTEIYSVCLTETSCQYNVDESACAGGNYYPPGSDSLADFEPSVCDIGCCTFNGQNVDGVTRWFCDQKDDSSFADTCPDTPPPETCGDQTLPEDKVCCDGEIKDTCDDSGVVNPPTVPPQGLCGNDVLDPEEECDGTILQSCDTSIESQYCTSFCTCAYDENTGPPTVCTPGNEDCTTTTQPCGLENGDLSLEAKHISGALAAEIHYGVTSSCIDSATSYSLNWFESDEPTSQSGLNLESSPTIIEPLKADIEYTIRLQVTFDEDGVERAVNTTTTFTTGDSACYTKNRAYCDGNTPRICNNENKAIAQNACGAEQVCAPVATIDGYSVACQPKVNCALCNTGYGTFAETNQQSVVINGEEVSCAELDAVNNEDAGITELTAYCYLDYQDGPTKLYKACADITSCYDYGTQEACDANTCFYNGEDACQWNEGANLCMPTDEEPKCDVDDITPAECGEIADYCEHFNNNCIDTRSTQTCDIYNGLGQEACEGQGYEMNQVTHEVTQPSTNAYDLPKCAFVNNICRKDSDDDGRRDRGGNEYELSDFEAPNTIILTDTNLPVGQQPTLRFTVEDKLPTRTYANVFEGACDTSDIVAFDTDRSAGIVNQAARTMNLNSVTEDGTYCVTYYSEDYTNNLEEITQTEIQVIAQAPTIIREEQNVAYNQNPPFADLSLEVDISEIARCTFDFNGAVDQSWSGRAQNFSMTYPAVPEGTYTVAMDCVNAGGRLTKTYNYTLDFDSSIQNPQPKLSVNRSSAYNRMSIDVQDQNAECEYRQVGRNIRGDWTAFEQVTPLGDVARYSSPAPKASSGLYYFETRCFLSGSEFIGSNADTIQYAIDDLGPSIEISSQGEEINPQRLVVPQQGLSIDVECTDEPITGIPQSQSNNPTTEDNFEAGDVTIYLNGEQINTEGESTAQIGVDESTQATITCEDALGNQATAVTLNADLEDIKGPERPEFEVVS